MTKPAVKVITIQYGVLGNPNNARIEKAIKKWLGKGYRLEDQQEIAAGFMRAGKTRLTFIKDA